MARYSNAQLQALWIKAGGNPRSAPLAAAVALGESGGDPNNLGDGGQSHGLWQVYTPAHPNYSASKLHDPLYNARAAVAISSNGRNWQPWTVFNQGIYRQFLTGPKQAPIPGITDPARPKAPKVTGVQATAASAGTSQQTLAAQMLANQNAARTAGTQLAPTAAASPLPDPGFSRALRVPGGAQLPQLGPPTPPEPVAVPATTAAAGTTALAASKVAAPKPVSAYSSPLPKGLTRNGGRTDNGVDIETRPGTPLLAIGSGRIVNTQGEFPGGSIVLKLDRPPPGAPSQYVYYGHLSNGSKRVRPGQRVTAGQMIARTSSSPPGAGDLPGHTEIGYARNPAGVIFTGGHAEGATGWGNIFSNWLKSNWRV